MPETAVSQKCSTGIAGLDAILSGGFSRRRLYLIEGMPGAGKTTLALQCLLEGARNGEKALYVTLSESMEELEEVARTHGWNLKEIVAVELEALASEFMEGQNTLFHPSEVELTQTMKRLRDVVMQVKPTLAVIDSLSELRLLSQQPLRFRQQILFLKQFFAERNCTVLALDDLAEDFADHTIESVAHGIIRLTTHTPGYGGQRRWLEITKYRALKYVGGLHDCRIETGGMVVFPRLLAAGQHSNFRRVPLSSGMANLDRLLGGGIDSGTSTVFMGPAGTGKSALSLAYAAAAANRGERALFITFDESASTIWQRDEAFGLGLRAHAERGLFSLRQINPAEVVPGELANSIRAQVVQGNVGVVVIDSLNGYMQAMPEERFLVLHLHELLMYLNQQGVATIVVLTMQGILGQVQSTMDLTYLADSVLLLRYFECEGAVRQAISVVKKRSGSHERTIRELRVGRNGIEVGEPFTNFRGILTGVPQIAGEGGSKPGVVDACP